MKRAFDATISAIGLLLCTPLFIVLLVLVTLETPGGAIFAQTRVGRNGEPFTCYKFRTMHADTAHVPTHEVSKSAITRFGRLLRATKIDELPQLVNVIRGDMSLVGPRPCLTTQTALINARRERGVLGLRPGVTGLAQVRGVDMSEPERLAAIDAEYVARQSLGLDLLILFTTVLGRKLLPV